MRPDPRPSNSDAFVERLRGQPLKGLPPDWRTDILAAAGAELPRTTPWPGAVRALGAWLWPNSLAYAGLASVWVLILAFHLLTPSSPPPAAEDSAARQASAADGTSGTRATGFPPQQMFLFAGNRQDLWP